MTTAVVDSPKSEQAQAWWFLDTLVVEHRCAPEMDTIVLEMTLPVGSAPPLHVHDDLDDTWYILDGEMVVRCGDDELVVGAGHWVSMPAACRTRSGWSVTARHGSCSCTTTPASGTSFAIWALRPRRASFRVNRCFRRWTNWRESPPPTTSGRSGPLERRRQRQRLGRRELIGWRSEGGTPCTYRLSAMSCSRSGTCTGPRGSTRACWECGSSRGSRTHA